MFCTHDIFFCVPLCLKTIFLGLFKHLPTSFLLCIPITPQSKKYKIFLFWCMKCFPIFFSVPLVCFYPMLSTLNVLVPSIAFKNSCPTQCSQCFDHAFFLTPLLIFVFILSFFFGILIYLLFSIFLSSLVLPKCVFVVNQA